VIPEITIKISMRPDEVTISQGQSPVREECFTIPSVPAEPEAASQAEQLIPPVPEEAVLMYGEDEDILPPVVKESDILGGDEYIEPPEAVDDIVDSTSDELPDIPPVE
jgi:hypothetical protein